jgi:hypothetical protein
MLRRKYCTVAKRSTESRVMDLKGDARITLVLAVKEPSLRKCLA